MSDDTNLPIGYIYSWDRTDPIELANRFQEIMLVSKNRELKSEIRSLEIELAVRRGEIRPHRSKEWLPKQETIRKWNLVTTR